MWKNFKDDNKKKKKGGGGDRPLLEVMEPSMAHHGPLGATSQAQTGFHTFHHGGDKTAGSTAGCLASPRTGSSCSVRSH